MAHFGAIDDLLMDLDLVVKRKESLGGLKLCEAAS